MKSKTTARLASIESLLIGYVERQREARIVAGLDRLTPAECDELDILGRKTTPPESHGSHGNGMLPGCQCGKCEHFDIYTSCGGKLTEAEEIRYRELHVKVMQ